MELDIFQKAKTVPILTVIGRYIPLTKKGGWWYGLCPFHDDKHIGSFVIFPNSGRFKCYACGESGDAIDFVGKICGVDALTASIRIAEDAGLIATGAVRRIRETSRRQVNMERALPPKQELEQSLLAPKADMVHMDKVYQCFASVADPLTKEFREMLLHERRLTEDDLRSYFVYPSRSDAAKLWPKFRAQLTKVFGPVSREGQAKLLLGVPGFFLDHNRRVQFAAQKERGLGIMVYNRDKLLSGLQIRAVGAVEKNQRYRFMSSGFANGSSGSCGSYGCACGYVEDILFPKEKKWNHTIAITEGRFKADALSKLGFLVVNLHSISNWSAGCEAAAALAQTWKPRKFIAAYDAESNPAVHRSAQHLHHALNPIRPVEFAVWDPKYGKGIDDVVNSGNINKISCVSPQEYLARDFA